VDILLKREIIEINTFCPVIYMSFENVSVRQLISNR
jgi:hypothetical protein